MEAEILSEILANIKWCFIAEVRKGPIPTIRREWPNFFQNQVYADDNLCVSRCPTIRPLSLSS